jgi:GNAT superfamily N-acetyltransferase
MGADQEFVTIVELTREAANDLMKDMYFAGSDILEQGQIHNLLQSVGLKPHSTKLVAYHLKNKIAVGFLCLKENTDKFYAIEKVFVHPNYRKQGIATKLLNFAICVALKKGANKISLIVYPTRPSAIKLYKKFGFEEIGHCILGQGNIGGSSVSRVIKRIIIGQGPLVRFSLGKDSGLIEVRTNSGQDRLELFNILKMSTDQRMIDFFEFNPDNITKDYKLIWRPPFFRDILINRQSNSFASIVTKPLSSSAKVELYNCSETTITSVLDSLLKALSKRGIGCTQIMLFNSINEAKRWFAEKSMSTFEFVIMGKTLNVNVDHMPTLTDSGE